MRAVLRTLDPDLQSEWPVQVVCRIPQRWVSRWSQVYTSGRSVALESGGILRLLLTSAGVKNASIHHALVDLLGKPIADSSALCIPTAQYGHPMVGPGVGAWRFISGNSDQPMVDLGWKWTSL